jgi:PAS domain S-box-containing protein
MESRRKHDSLTSLCGSTLADNMQDGIFSPIHSSLHMGHIEHMRHIEHTDAQLVQRLRLSEARYRSLLAATTQIVWTTGADGRTPGDMDSWCQYTGQNPNTIDGDQIVEAIHPGDRQRVMRIWTEAIHQQSPYKTWYRLRRADGIYRIFSVRGVPVLDEEGTVREWVGACTDITQQQELKEQLRESEQRFRLIFELAPVGISHVGLDGQWLHVNQCLCDMLGYTAEELQATTFQALTHPDDLPKGLAYMQRILAGEMPNFGLEKRYIRKDGSVLWANVRTTAVRNAEDEPLYLISVVEDISARKQAEQAAAEHAARMEATLAALADPLTVYDREGKLLFVNPSAQRLFALELAPAGYTEEPLEKRLQSYHMRDEHGQPLPYERWPQTRVLRGEVLTGEHAADVMIRLVDGNEREYSLTGAPMYDTEGQISGAVLISRDVTQRRQLERRTHAALTGLLAMAETLVQLASPETGEEHNDLFAIGRHIAQLTCNVLDCQRVGVAIIEPATERIVPLAVLGLPPEDERRWWAEQEQETNTLGNSPMPELVEQLRNGQVLVLNMQDPLFRDQPNPYHIQVMVAAPMRIQGRIVGLLTLDYDNIDHHYTENELALISVVAQLSALVFERERLIAAHAEARGRELSLRTAKDHMEEFLGIASHELRTPMTTIKANIQLAQRRLATLMRAAATLSPNTSQSIEAAREMLSRAERQIGVLNRLVGDLIDISRIQRGKLELHLRPEPCDLTAIVQETVQEQRKANPTRTLELELLSNERLPVYVDPDRIAQVLTNYISNALKYSPPDRPILIQLAKGGSAQAEKAGKTEQTTQLTAHVAVRDEGPGLPPEEQSRVWECFYQASGIKVLSGSGVGLGLGLHISQTLIQRHGGEVGVISTPPHGSTFWFTLPLVPDHGD